MNIGQTILEQLGGSKFIAMTGCNHFVWDSNTDTLRMIIPRNGSKANRLHIKYNIGSDTYSMRFFKYIPGGLKIDRKKGTADFVEDKEIEVKEYKEVYCDQLQELFTEVTHMYTRLF